MARISGVDIPRDKRVVISLTYIFGIGKPTAQKILKDLGIRKNFKLKNKNINKRKTIQSWEILDS